MAFPLKNVWEILHKFGRPNAEIARKMVMQWLTYVFPAQHIQNSLCINAIKFNSTYIIPLWHRYIITNSQSKATKHPAQL